VKKGLLEFIEEQYEFNQVKRVTLLFKNFNMLKEAKETAKKMTLKWNSFEDCIDAELLFTQLDI